MLQLPNTPYQIVAICTSKPKSEQDLKDLKNKYGQHLLLYTDPAEMAKSPNIDLFVVSVKCPDHEKAITPALELDITKKKDVFVEWPVTGSLKVCQALAENAKKLGVKSMVGMQGRQSLVLKKVM